MIFLVFLACVSATRSEGPITAEPPPPAPVVSPCVDTCVQSRQMEAVAIDDIRANCEVQCGEREAPPGLPN